MHAASGNKNILNISNAYKYSSLWIDSCKVEMIDIEIHGELYCIFELEFIYKWNVNTNVRQMHLLFKV